MRIDDLNRAPVTPGTEKAGQTAQSAAPRRKCSSGLGPSRTKRKYLSWPQSLAAPDPGRIEQLRLQVQSGSYDVSAQAVANALIDAHLKE